MKRNEQFDVSIDIIHGFAIINHNRNNITGMKTKRIKEGGWIICDYFTYQNMLRKYGQLPASNPISLANFPQVAFEQHNPNY